MVTRWLKSLGAAVVVAGAALPVTATAASVGVAVLHSADWSPNDAVRDGAGEFEVLLCLAQLQRSNPVAGVVSVGDRHGCRQCGGELALRHAALAGVVVVKLSPGGALARDPDELFVDGGQLNERDAAAVLTATLRQVGAAPAASDPDRPTAREPAAIHAHLARIQSAFALQRAVRVAAQ